MYLHFIFQLRTPFNWVLINLSITEFIIALGGNSLLAFNSFCSPQEWAFSNTACQASAFGMTYLGKFQFIPSLAVKNRGFETQSDFSSQPTTKKLYI